MEIHHVFISILVLMGVNLFISGVYDFIWLGTFKLQYPDEYDAAGRPQPFWSGPSAINFAFYLQSKRFRRTIEDKNILNYLERRRVLSNSYFMALATFAVLLISFGIYRTI